MLNTKNFSLIWSASLQTADRDEYISDWSLSSIWGDDPADEIPSERIEMLGALWDVAHLSVRDIRTHTGLSQRKFANAFGIPARTIENWESGVRVATDYTRLLLADAVGLIDINSVREID